MVRIASAPTVAPTRIGTGASGSSGPGRDAAGDPTSRSGTRALVVVDGGGADEAGGGRAPPVRRDAVFVAQLIACADASLPPTRTERTRLAAVRYREAARRLA